MLTMRKLAGGRARFWPTALALVALAGCQPDGPRLLLEGEKLIQRGEYTSAVEKLQAATAKLTLPGQAAQAWNQLGLARHGAGQPREAEQSYRKALSLDPDLAVVRFNVGCLSLEQNHLAAALDDLRSYTLLRTNSVEGWMKLGAAQLRSRQNDAAEKSFHTALRLNARLPEALNNLGVIQQQRRKTREAFLQFTEALKYQSNYPPALLNLAIVSQQHSLGRPYAADIYREYLALQPRPDNWASVSEVLRQLELELHPPPASVLTQPITNTPAGPTRTNAPLVRGSVPTNILVTLTPAPATATATPTNRTSIVKTNPPLVAKIEPPEPTVENQPKPPPPVTAPSVTPVPPARPPATNTTTIPMATNAPKPLLANPHSTSTQLPDSGRPGFFQRLNPVNLFRSKPKPAPRTTELKPPAPPATPEVPSQAVVDQASTPAPLPLQPAYTRYKYVRPAQPAPGNRTEAEDAFTEALLAQREKRWPAAVEAYQTALKLDPAFFEAHHNLGLTLLETGNLSASLLAFENALAIDPQSVNAHLSFATVLRKSNHPLDAADELEKALLAAPNEVRVHFSLANLCAQQLSQVARAREHYRKVLELEPKHPQGTAIRYWLAANP